MQDQIIIKYQWNTKNGVFVLFCFLLRLFLVFQKCVNSVTSLCDTFKCITRIGFSSYFYVYYEYDLRLNWFCVGELYSDIVEETLPTWGKPSIEPKLSNGRRISSVISDRWLISSPVERREKMESNFVVTRRVREESETRQGVRRDSGGGREVGNGRADEGVRWEITRTGGTASNTIIDQGWPLCPQPLDAAMATAGAILPRGCAEYWSARVGPMGTCCLAPAGCGCLGTPLTASSLIVSIVVLRVSNVFKPLRETWIFYMKKRKEKRFKCLNPYVTLRFMNNDLLYFRMFTIKQIQFLKTY